MRKRNRIILAVSVMALVIIGAVMWKISTDNAHAAQTAREQGRLKDAYERQWEVFHLRGEPTRYIPYSQKNVSRNALYCDLAYYKKMTGNVLLLEEIEAYLSQEFEDDGSVRIYYNGKHADINDYVEWSLNHDKKRDKYITDIIYLYGAWRKEHGKKWGDVLFDDIELVFLDELIKKEANPKYTIQYKPENIK